VKTEARRRIKSIATTMTIGALTTISCAPRVNGQAVTESAQVHVDSAGMYRLPFENGALVKVFDDFQTHRPRRRVDLFVVENSGSAIPVVAAADGIVRAIEDGYSEQQSGRAAALPRRPVLTFGLASIVPVKPDARGAWRSDFLFHPGTDWHSRGNACSYIFMAIRSLVGWA
jgi:hypothetical protein